jgi:hypothetical protein
MRFIEDGFLPLPDAFPRELADEARALLWRDTGCDPDNPARWTRPVVRLGDYSHEPFRRAVNTPRLRAAFDALVGPGRWQPRGSLGVFPVRCPSRDDPGDTGWHVDASFPGDKPDDYLAWRINVTSRGRALLMLFLFSDVGSATRRRASGSARTRTSPACSRRPARPGCQRSSSRASSTRPPTGPW